MRRKVVSGYARGEATRTRILDVAVHLFGTYGYDGVSTRDIAAAAEVPTPSLRYYFVNKQGLYVACLVHLQAGTIEMIEPALQAAEQLLADAEADGARLIDAYCAMQDALVDYMIGRPESAIAALFIVRHDLPSVGGASQFSGGDGTHAFRMTACFTQMMMRISGNTLDPRAALVVAGLINGQLTTIYLRRHRLAEMGWTIEGERLQWLKNTIRQQTAAILRSHQPV